MKCDGCHKNKPTTGAIINGVFGQYCRTCRSNSQRLASAGSASYSRQADRDAHEADLVQPWDVRGNPNRDFIRLHPEQSKDMFTKEELENYG